MAAEEVTVKSGDQSASIYYDFGDNLQEALALFGESVVFTACKRQLISDCGNKMRAMLKIGKTQDEITELMKSWTPGAILRVGGDPIAALKRAAPTMSAEDIQKTMRELQELLESKQV